MTLTAYLVTVKLPDSLSSCIRCKEPVELDNGNHLYYFDGEMEGFVCRKCKPMGPYMKGRGIPIWKKIINA